MSDEIPKWAKERAAALANGSRSAERPSRENLPSDCDAFPDMHAFARYIAAHEQPQVDPDVIAVRDIAKAFCGDGTIWDESISHDDIDRGCYDQSPIFAAVLETLRKHKEAGK